MSTTSSAAQVKEHKHFSSSIWLWVRTDRPRQVGMDYWKGPHSGIIAASPGLEEYRQIHLDETNPGRWPDVAGVETETPVDRKVDGVAEVTFQSLLSPLKGRKQTQLAFKDEINVFGGRSCTPGPRAPRAGMTSRHPASGSVHARWSICAARRVSPVATSAD